MSLSSASKAASANLLFCRLLFAAKGSSASVASCGVLPLSLICVLALLEASSPACRGASCCGAPCCLLDGVALLGFVLGSFVPGSLVLGSFSFLEGLLLLEA